MTNVELPNVGSPLLPDSVKLCQMLPVPSESCPVLPSCARFCPAVPGCGLALNLLASIITAVTIFIREFLEFLQTGCHITTEPQRTHKKARKWHAFSVTSVPLWWFSECPAGKQTIASRLFTCHISSRRFNHRRGRTRALYTWTNDAIFAHKSRP